MEIQVNQNLVSSLVCEAFLLSGGPLQIYNRDPYCTYTQIGIVSFGLKKCGTIGTAGAYASVFYYRDWIEGVVWRGEN